MKDVKTDLVEQLPPLRETIATYELHAQKNLGQNFLLDLNLTRKIARAAGDLSSCPIIEIGPGPGGLTRALLIEGAQNVCAIEYDPRAIIALAPLVEAAQGRLEVISGDALRIDWGTFRIDHKVKIVANLPYNIATPLLIGWLKNYHHYESLTLMFQREVAERLVAKCDTRAYGRLSVITQWFMNAEILFNVPASAFVPAPKVVSSIVRLVPRPQPFQDIAVEKLEKFLAVAFNQRRKMLRVTLKSIFKDPTAVLLSEGIDPTRRAETLTLEEFGRLTNLWEK